MTRFAFAALLLCIPLPALALLPQPYYYNPVDAELPAKNDTDDPQQTPITPDMVSRSRDWLADYLDSLSGNIDGFFVDTFFSDTVTDDDVEGSRARLSWFTRRELGDPVDYRFGLSVKLVLPNTNERLNLLLESDEDEDNREADPIESLENPEYTAALRFILDETEEWKTNIDAGVRWGIPPDPFIRLRARRYVYLSEWEMRFTQQFYYRTQDGWGEETQIRFDHPINVEKLFRVEAKAEYQLNQDYLDLSYSAGLFHQFSRHSALAYTFGASGDTQQHATFYQYSARVRSRQSLYQDWVFAEVAQELVWERDKDYETTPVIMFRIEALIGQ